MLLLTLALPKRLRQYDLMAASYPELSDKRSYVAKVILHEEERFSRTLERGLQLLEEAVAALPPAGERVLPGSVVFRLYDTFGFPVDLTADIVRDRGIRLDEAEFEAEMDAQRDKARKAWKGSGDAAVAAVYRELHEAGVASRFAGYETPETRAPVRALLVEAEGGSRGPGSGHQFRN